MNVDLAMPPRSRQREVLDEVRVFRSLSAEERDALSQRMTTVEYLADQVILEVGAHSDHLLVIGSGVVSASVRDGDKLLEAGRMGPGEVLGWRDHRRRRVTGRVPYTDQLRAVPHRQRAGEKLPGATWRCAGGAEQVAAVPAPEPESLLLQKPALIKKGGFLSWLHK